MKKITALLITALFAAGAISPHILYAGWKENYREKYSKRQLDPNSEKAKKLRRLMNMNFTYPSWKNRKAPSWTWLGRDKTKDQFEGYVTNITPARQSLPKEEASRTGRTLTRAIQSVGEPLGLKPSTPQEEEDIK